MLSSSLLVAWGCQEGPMEKKEFEQGQLSVQGFGGEQARHGVLLSPQAAPECACGFSFHAHR